MKLERIKSGLERALRRSLEAPRLRLVSLDGKRPEIDSVRQPWIGVKYGTPAPDDWCGVAPAVAAFRRQPEAPIERLRLAIKVNPAAGLARTLIPWIIQNRGVALGRPYGDYAAAREFDRTGAREYQVVLSLASRAPALSRVLPRCYGGAIDEATGEHAIFLAFIDDIARLDASGASADWPGDRIAAALGAAAGWHGAFYGKVDGEDCAFAALRGVTAERIADESLWRGLLDDARGRFPQIMTDAVWRRRQRLVDTIDVWHKVKDAAPLTLVHDDFNERNCGFGPAGPIVLDWELAARDAPQRDLVEMLTFVLPASTARAEIDSLVDGHRRAVAAAVGREAEGLDPDRYMEGFRAELKLEAINRIGCQFLFAAGFPLAYLGRINDRIEYLLDLYH